MNELIALDKLIFALINGAWHHPTLDLVLPLVRNKLLWIPLYLFILSFMTINFRSTGLMFLLFLGVTAGLADVTSSRLVKLNVERVRPCNDPDIKREVRSLVRCGSGYSFTSSHATNHFAVAFFLIFSLGRIWKWIRWPLFFWAALISYAQVYVGVHYPLDVLGGALLGSLIGTAVSWLYGRSSWGRHFYNQVQNVT